MKGERGSALVIAVLVMAIMTLLGMAFLLMADTENKISENERLSAQALYFGEGVAREVKRWFDRPPYTAAGDANLSRPTTDVIDRTQRTALPYYKVGVDNDGDGHDDIFDKPYRSDPKDMFVGTSDKPDIRMERVGHPATAAFLDDLAEKIMPDFPAGWANVRARIKTIDVYGPPLVNTGGGILARYGIATVSVRLQILRNPGAADEKIMAERTVTAVLNETPFSGVFGPLHSCDELSWSNAFKVHWGTATAMTTGDMPGGTSAGMPTSIPQDLPASPKLNLVHGHLAGDPAWGLLVNGLEGKTIPDPWFRFFAGLGVVNWSALSSPQVNPPGVLNPDESNKFQNYPNVPCPQFDYTTWKSIARSGGSDVHYYAYNGSSEFKESGSGASGSLENLTNGKTGLFFFDTTDGLPPHDFDAGNVAGNLTPDISISLGGYGVQGFLYVNARSWGVAGSPGRPATFTFPGEPFRDSNENGIRESTEPYINLRYTGITSIDDPLVVDDADTYDPSVLPPATPIRTWNATGPKITHDAIVWGILYLSGKFDASGTPYYDGSVVTYAGTPTGTKTAGTANLYWDPTLTDNWPPVGWNLPRVIITRWETDE
jgi:hypothetical protein